MNSCVFSIMSLLVTNAAAFSYSSDDDLMGKMLLNLGSEGTGIVQLLPKGSVLNFSEPVNVDLYVPGEFGDYTTKSVQTGCTQFTLPDTTHTYIFSVDDEDGIVMFRGASSTLAPIMQCTDDWGGKTLKFSKPVVDITVERLTGIDWDGNPSEEYCIVYNVPVGTTISSAYSEMLISDMWDPQGANVPYEQLDALSSKQFPNAQKDVEMGMPLLPVTLNDIGYHYEVRDMSASFFPVIRVVDKQPETFTPRTASFTDMNWSKSYVEKVYGYGWMEGMGGGKFAPQGDLTVAQAITLAARIHSATRNYPIDGSDGPWYQTYLDYCQNHSLLYNYEIPDLEARLNDKVTRLDTLRILSVAASLPCLGWNEEETAVVPDVDRDSEYGSLVYDWYRAGIITGDAGTHNFRPDSTITRGEMAAILCRLLGL